MSVAATSFSRVISDRHFVGRSLLMTSLVAVVASLLLVIMVLCVGGIMQLVDQGPDVAGLTDATTSTDSWPMNLIGRVVTQIPLLHSSGAALTLLFAGLVVVILIRTYLRNFVHRHVQKQIARSVGRLREHIQRQALRSNPGDLSGTQQKHATRLFRETAQVLEDNACLWGFHRLSSICDLGVLLVILLSVQWRVGIECIVPILLCWYIARVESDRSSASAHLLTEQVDRGLDRLTADLEKARIVAGYGMEKTEHESFSARLTDYQRRCAKLDRQRRRGMWTSLLIRLAAAALPAFILARHLLFGTLISLPAAVVLATVIGLTLLCVLRLQNLPKYRGEATVAAEEINQYLLRVPSVSQVVGARFLEPMSRVLQFSQITVETETQPELLSSLDLKIDAGQRVAILSLNRLEALALVNLIPRFSDPQRGQVLIDGTDIRHVTLESLRAEAVIVGGDEPLFNTTIIENITAGQADISRQDAIAASKLVHAESFIRQLPKGYETNLDDIQLTQPGQRFRLSLARAVARNPALLIIQEPDAVLDPETKAMLDDTYQRICANRTVIFLPTRLSTVKRCDRIVMIHQGRVAVDGRHDDLVKSSELYRHWEYMRFNVFRENEST